MTIGDVMAVVAFLSVLAVTLWAAILLTGLLFSERARRAAGALEKAPKQCLGIGALVGVAGIALGLVLVNAKGIGGLIGWIILAFTLLVAVIGTAGLARIVGERMQVLGSNHTPLTTLARGGALLVMTGFLPGLGWLLLFPLQLFAGVGAGLSALGSRERYPYEQPIAQSQQQ